MHRTYEHSRNILPRQVKSQVRAGETRRIVWTTIGRCGSLSAGTMYRLLVCAYTGGFRLSTCDIPVAGGKIYLAHTGTLYIRALFV